MARFCPLFSSSSGNCTYIGTTSGGILIDAGVSAKRIREALHCIGVDISRIGAIFVTHEHTDHIAGVRVLASNNHIPVFGSKGTLSELERTGVLNGKFPYEVATEGGTDVGDLHIVPFHTSHDSRESLGYNIFLPDGRKVTVATDTGILTDETKNAMVGSALVLMESNHDVAMLVNGPYPYSLKRRILSPVGHLSNDACAEFAKELMQGGTGRLFLGHLSKENNHPSLAYQTTEIALSQMGAKAGIDYELTVAPPAAPALTVF